MTVHDWGTIKTEYVTTNTSYSRLAEKYGVNIGQVKYVAARDGWTKARKQFSADVQQKAYRKACNHEAARLARLIAATTNAVDVATKALADDDQFNRYLVERREKYAVPVEAGGAGDGEGEAQHGQTAQSSAPADGGDEALPALVTERQWTEERIYNKVDTKALKDLTGVLKDLTGLVRDLYGLPTQAQAEAQRIAAGRLELERRKLETGSSTPEVLEIVGLPEEYKQ